MNKHKILFIILLLLLLVDISIAKGGGNKSGESNGNSSANNNRKSNTNMAFFRYANGRRICAIVCICGLTAFLFVAIILVILSVCCCCKRNKKNNANNTMDGGDGGESGINNNVNNVNRNNDYDDSLPPPYESTNPAPDPSHKLGKKNDATINSLNDARDFSKRYPPNENFPTPEEIENIITKDGYKAWKFVPEDVIIKAKRVLISNDKREVEFCKRTNRKNEFKYDDIMIQTNYPFFIPVNSEEIELDILHYFEVTLLSKSKGTVAIGITTKPYPYFRLPGWNINSVGYHSDDGRKFLSDEFGGRDYGPVWGKSGDVIGCGYKPKTGEIFFTKNGTFLGIAFAGLRHTWYPTIGSDGDARMRVNFGDELFVYKDFNWFGVGAPKEYNSKN